MLNTAVAESLEQFADALEGSKNFEADLQALIRSVLIKHKRILFNGNGYDDAWLAEAERRGLLNLRTTPEALPYYLADKNVALFTKHRVYTRTEMEARYEIHLENYSKVLNIEALTMLEMARRDIMPAVSSYLRELSETATATLCPSQLTARMRRASSPKCPRCWAMPTARSAAWMRRSWAPRPSKAARHWPTTTATRSFPPWRSCASRSTSLRP